MDPDGIEPPPPGFRPDAPPTELGIQRWGGWEYTRPVVAFCAAYGLPAFPPPPGGSHHARPLGAASPHDAGCSARFASREGSWPPRCTTPLRKPSAVSRRDGRSIRLAASSLRALSPGTGWSLSLELHGDRTRNLLISSQALCPIELANVRPRTRSTSKFRALLGTRMLRALRLSLSGNRRRFRSTKPPLRDPGRMVPALG